MSAGAVARPVSLPRALSKLGVCSRAQAFLLIAGGRVAVDGTAETDPARRVDLANVRIMVDGVERREARTRDGRAGTDERIVVALHKPPGVVTTRSDPQGRPTVYDLIPSFERFVFPVGRLDLDTSGLLLFTDDHRLGEALTSPAHGAPKTYAVEVTPTADAASLRALRAGVNIGRGETTRPARVESRPDGAGAVLEITLREGRNRQIRRMCAAVGLEVRSLHRTRIGPLAIGGLAAGGWRRLERKEIAALRRASGAASQAAAVRASGNWSRTRRR